MNILVTGGMGFIGSALIRLLMRDQKCCVLNMDALTYAARPDAVAAVASDPRYVFQKCDITDAGAVRDAFVRFKPDIVMHLAAESHVDRSITGADAFVQSNVFGTFVMLEAVRGYWSDLNDNKKRDFRFIHVSTDEVYGALMPGDAPFHENTPYAPNSPYSASKAASDHFARAWFKTYGLPTIITHCSNNYGPWQADEKLIPTMIRKALSGDRLPVYGTGKNIRDWLYVDDHARALWAIAQKGTPGDVYNIGGDNEWTNIDIVNLICAQLDVKKPRADGASYTKQIAYVTDRPGHDFRYAIDNAKIEQKIGWKPQVDFKTGLDITIDWYINQYTKG